MIKENYKIYRKSLFKKQKKSALRNSDSVMDSIKYLLANKLVNETNNTLHLISPFLMAENSAGKKRLILDLRYVNKHIHTYGVKFEVFSKFS